ncbi:hypothetical protein [Paraclostridium sordellii]|uniref:hypothetical protein n=1 Tax=Paraclostridium sordellii TaxID=1505 RepID=UPI0030CFAE32
MSIKIGDNNKIKKSKIIDNSNSFNKNESEQKESFVNEHPIFIAISCSIVASVLMMFPFWDKVSQFIKSLF